VTAPNALLVRAVSLLLLAGSLAVARPGAARAQQLAGALPPAWDAAPLTAPAASAVRVDQHRRDYRWVGTVVGAVALGLAAGLEARAACGNSESGPRDCTAVTLGVGALGAAVGGVIGNFAGRIFRRG
jgi:hypothetical protein